MPINVASVNEFSVTTIIVWSSRLKHPEDKIWNKYEINFNCFKNRSVIFVIQRIWLQWKKINEMYIMVRVQIQINPCRIYSEQIGIVTEFSRSTSSFLYQYYSTDAPCPFNHLLLPSMYNLKKWQRRDIAHCKTLASVYHARSFAHVIHTCKYLVASLKKSTTWNAEAELWGQR